MWRWYPGGRPDPPDGRNSDRDPKSDSREKDFTKKISVLYPPIPFTKIEHWSVLVKGMGPMGGHEGDPTENGCFSEGKRAAAECFLVNVFIRRFSNRKRAHARIPPGRDAISSTQRMSARPGSDFIYTKSVRAARI